MGNRSGDSYDLGVGLGLASYQASVNQFSLAADALNMARLIADKLEEAGIGILGSANITARVKNEISNFAHFKRLEPENLTQTRQAIEQDLRDSSNDCANCYRLGLLIAMAEGQTTNEGAWNQAVDIAHGILKEAQTVILQNLSQVHFDSSLISTALQRTQNIGSAPGDAHAAVSTLRTNYSDTIRRSGLA